MRLLTSKKPRQMPRFWRMEAWGSGVSGQELGLTQRRRGAEYAEFCLPV